MWRFGKVGQKRASNLERVFLPKRRIVFQLVQQRQGLDGRVAAFEDLRVLLVLKGPRQLRHALLQIIAQPSGVHGSLRG